MEGDDGRLCLRIRRRKVSHRYDAYSIAVYVDVRDENWYNKLKKDFKCSSITTASYQDISLYPFEDLQQKEVYAEGDEWTANIVQRIVIPVIYRRDYLKKMDDWLINVEEELTTSIVAEINMMNPTEFRKCVLSHVTNGKDRSKTRKKFNLHKIVNEKLKEVTRNQPGFEMDPLKKNTSFVADRLLRAIKNYIHLHRDIYNSEMARIANHSLHEKQDKKMDILSSIVLMALRKVFGTENGRCYVWINLNECKIDAELCGNYEQDVFCEEDPFALFHICTMKLA